ncbi:hypothetical protein FDZ84_26945 [Saccharopolyspora sp. ASAGF58]|nr:hypothetical protein FDZ84_26945 [Saccharopolyspora sp. ASAGF58]
MGRLLYESVVNNDVPALQPGIMSLVGLAVLITTLTDQLYACINRPISAPGR